MFSNFLKTDEGRFTWEATASFHPTSSHPTSHEKDKQTAGVPGNITSHDEVTMGTAL